MQEQIIRTDYAEVMQKSYVDYAMSVIISRALPDIRDGLKPVQRRTLYDMYELAIRYDKPYRKCARIVGDTMGKYHPHGDSSIYDALVVMAQEFKKGMPLVDGHGNFGSIEGDGAAAMRYTEARLQKVTQEVFLADLDKDVVDFMPNFDETEKEPTVLPVRLPNFLVNGSDGIAVGMVTSTPPHNLGEVIDAVKAYMKNDKLTTADLMWISVRIFLIQPTFFKKIFHAFACFFTTYPHVSKTFPNSISQRTSWVKRFHRHLKNHLYILVNITQSLPPGMRNILLFKKNPSLCGSFQMRDHPYDCALSGSGFTYDPEALTPL